MTDWGSCIFRVAMIREAHALGNAERVQRTTQAVNGMPERRLLELCRDTYVEATKKKREGGREQLQYASLLVLMGSPFAQMLCIAS